MRQVIVFFLTLFLSCNLLAINTLMVYSARKEQLVKPVFDLYSKKTGVKIIALSGKEAALIKRLESEGKNSKADIFMTVDAGNLWHAEKKGLFKSLDSNILKNNIPSHLRSPNDQWFGFSVRARTIVYSKKRVKKDNLSTYEDLAHPRWQGKLCLRTSKKVYNQSLVAMMIANNNESLTEEVVRGWVKNLARPVFSSDTSLIKAIDSGECDVGIVNSYYLGRAQEKNPKLSVGIFWPNQRSSGVHVNISGAGILKTSKNIKEAKKFLEWLSTDEAQKKLSEYNHEYPANKKVAVSIFVKSWGDFKHNLINVTKAGELQISATKLMDRAHYR